MEAAVRVDAVLRAGVAGRALVHVHARLAVPLQLEAGVAPALQGQKVPGGEGQNLGSRNRWLLSVP